jgi:hypothetical protein
MRFVVNFLLILSIARRASAENATLRDMSGDDEVTLSSKAVQIFDLRGRLSDDQTSNGITAYGQLVLGMIAIFCNIINITVMGKQKNMSPYIYLTLIASFDFITGVVLLLNGIINNTRFLRSSEVVSVLSFYTQSAVYFIRSWTATVSSYLAMALSVDRLIAIRHPMKRAILCTPRRARITAAVLIALAVIPNVHTAVRMHSVWYELDNDKRLPIFTYNEFGFNPLVTAIAQYGSFILKQVVPLGVLILTNTMTIWEIFKSMKFRKQMSSSKGKEVQCLGITVGVIVLFIVTNTPTAIFVFRLIVYSPIRNFSFAFLVFATLIEFVPWSNVYLNFVVYIVLNKRFREDAVAFVCCRAKAPSGQREQTTSVISMTKLA